MKKTAVLIDVSAIMYRAYFSLINMRTSKKEPTGAIFGFLNVFNDILDTFKPDYICACFDVKRDSLKRREIYEDYKAKREAMPEEMAVQIEGIENMLDIFNVKKLKIAGYEADDLLGALAKRFEEKGIDVIIVTGDKDLSQILSDKIKIALLSKGNEKFKLINTKEDVVEQLGVLPEQIPDLFGLQGDTSDGIPGVKGIGPKTAVKFINEYTTLEKLYENIEDIKGKMKEKLIEDKEMAFLSRTLAIIDTNVDFEFNQSEFEVKNPDEVQLFDFFKKFEFKSYIKKYNIDYANVENTINQNNEKNIETQNEDVKILPKEDLKFKIIKTYQELTKFLEKDKISLYNEKCGISLSDGVENIYIPLKHNYLGAENLEEKKVINIINNDFKGKITAFDIKETMKLGINFEKFEFDVMIGAYLLKTDEKYNIEKIIFENTEIMIKSYEEVFGKEEVNRINIEKASGFYCERAFYVFKLKNILIDKLEKENLSNIYYNIEMKLIEVLYFMEKNGIKIDKNYFKKYSIELEENIKNIQDKIFIITGEEFNLNSPKQLAEILFDKMGIKPVKKTKTGYSTDVEVLETLDRWGIEIASHILKNRTYTKLKNTYVDVLPKLADKNDRLHTTFHQNGTSTGRLSSSDPNLQNIPVKTEEGIKIRRGFVACEGYSLLSFDYSQIELRVLAELSKDEALINAYENDLDLHSVTAMKIMDIEDEKDITREQRSIAKVVNFSIIYGKTAFGLSKEIDISVSAAKEYIDKYFMQYKEVDKFIKETILKAEKDGYVLTDFGRKRIINGIDSKNKTIKNQAERMAVNTVIQGTAADILKIIMIKIHEELKNKNDIKMLLQVHDELIFEVKDDKIEYYSKFITDIMENTIKLKNVKLKSNLSYGKNWSETK